MKLLITKVKHQSVRNAYHADCIQKFLNTFWHGENVTPMWHLCKSGVESKDQIDQPMKSNGSHASFWLGPTYFQPSIFSRIIQVATKSLVEITKPLICYLNGS